ncbi:MAG: SHOCT domain-containing protein [Chloroflexota bacterium]|nr:SHOCT domain-containing protein [Chloroflexota bacterium]
MMFGWHHGDGLGMMGFGLFAWILLLVLIGIVVWLVVRTLGPRSPMRSPSEAEEILRRRLAAGEIDGDEYDRRLEILRRK